MAGGPLKVVDKDHGQVKPSTLSNRLHAQNSGNTATASVRASRKGPSKESGISHRNRRPQSSVGKGCLLFDRPL